MGPNMMGQHNAGFNQPDLRSVVGMGMPMQPPPVERINVPVSFIGDINQVSPVYVTNNGDLNLFITRDLQHIYVKCFNNDGTITTADYALNNGNNPNAQQNQQPDILVFMQNLQSTLTERLSAIENKLNIKNQNVYKQKQNYQNNPKKEGSNDGTSE